MKILALGVSLTLSMSAQAAVLDKTIESRDEHLVGSRRDASVVVTAGGCLFVADGERRVL